VAINDPNSHAIFSKIYGWYDAANHNNGNVIAIQDALTEKHSQYFGYDSLNRLTSAKQVDGAFNQTYAIDPWGNLKQSGAPISFQTNYTEKNRIADAAAFGYDASGNLTNNNGMPLIYDAESRIASLNNGAAAYTYGADSSRVRKDVAGGGTEYFYFNGQVISERNVATGDWSDYIYAAGQRQGR